MCFCFVYRLRDRKYQLMVHPPVWVELAVADVQIWQVMFLCIHSTPLKEQTLFYTVSD